MRAWLPTLLVALAACSQGGMRAALNQLSGDAYALDDHSRDAAPGAPCPAVELTTHGGQAVRYRPALRVTPPFVARLQQFERAVVQVAQQTYGRAPVVVRHAGAYVCRPVRSTAVQRWSEHAFGNAIDVVGFDFERAPRLRPPAAPATADAGARSALPPSLPIALQRRFTVRVATHWQAKPDPSAQLHQRFLRKLVARLARDDVFRGLLGPPDANHRSHLHLDMAPWRYGNL